MASTGDCTEVTLLVPLRPPYHCPPCMPYYRDYVDHGGLARHLRRGHRGKLNFECRACDKRSDKLKEIKLHQSKSTSCSSQIPTISPNSTRDPKQRQRVPVDPTRLRPYRSTRRRNAACPAPQDSSCIDADHSPPLSPTNNQVANPTPGQSSSLACPDDTSVTPRDTGSDITPPLIRRPRRRRHRRPSTQVPAAVTGSGTPPGTNTTTNASPTVDATPSNEPATQPPAAVDPICQPVTTTYSDNQPATMAASPDASQPAASTTASPPQWVTAWCERFDCAIDEDMLEVMVNDLTYLAQRMSPRQPTQTNNYQRQPRHPTGQRNNANRPRRYNAAEASRVQRLYRANKRKAFEEITRGTSRFCQIGKSALTDHFNAINSQPSGDSGPTSDQLPPPLQPTSDDPLNCTFTPVEVSSKLAKCHNTAPGPDGVRYYTWRRLDPQGHILALLFNAVHRIGAIPSAWRTSTTILLHKKGSHDDVRNWRPIALANTLGKIYAACIANRLLRWCEENNTISTAQKGFMRFEGCSEHTFVLQSIIQDARRRNKECHVAWLDLANAFGSVPHSTILSCLKWCVLGPQSIYRIQQLLSGCHTHICSCTGLTDPIPILAGVKQGCPLSPILFNIVVEPALRLLSGLQVGYSLHGNSVSALAYADDITIAGATRSGLQSQLDLLSSWAQHSGLSFNATKCATLSVANKYHCSNSSSSFKIQEACIPQLKKEDHYSHLGIPTGFTVGTTAESVIDGIHKDLRLVDTSCLAPWQKIDCVNTFLLPRLTFHLTLGNTPKKRLNDLDKTVKRCIKRWMHLPQRASPEIIYMPNCQGGANVTPCGILADIAQVSHATNLFLSRDPTISNLATKTLEKVVEKHIRRKPTGQDLCTYLTGSMENEFGSDPYDVPSLWTRLRMATRRLRNRIDLNWHPNEDGTLTPSIDGKPINKPTAFSIISTAVKTTFLGSLLRKPDQGKVFKLTATNKDSNHFLHDGNYIRFADWRFIHRARLSVVPLRGLRRFGNTTQRCRRCQRHRETLAHVINHCPPNLSQITKRHNAILNRLINAIDRRNLRIYTNQQIPDFHSTCRPDLVVINNNPKTATIVDIATPFENDEDAFNRAREEKIRKYNDLAAHYRHKGYDTYIDAFIVGALGGYDAANEGVIQRLGISRNYAKLMRRLMVSDCVKASRDIYTNHLGPRYQN
ncbi:uncharacterized protein LOC111633668 [Centruroides sculpturatus]|uniref:uncharacterized protein LOC111633668 n=1 Tax=Centruroides sculpturatus TaxID=218467 RepID=UPI000C6E4ADA|nr:uncharacterized protein LOC111633668 [Centruroides sculpturatus]